MSGLPQLSLSCEPLTHMLYNAIPARLLITAIELKVFSYLTEPLSANALARKIKTHAENSRIFLDALAANDLLYKRNGEYRNTPLADTFLVEGKSTYMGSALADDVEWMQPALESLTALVKDGKTASPRRPHSVPPAQEAEIRANHQRAGVAQEAVALVRRLPEFPNMKKMLDLGAGAGLIGLAIVGAHPSMTGVLFDRADVVAVAERFIREYQLEDRMTTIGGDYLTDSIGENYDLIWTRYTLSRETLDAVMSKIHAALNPGGVYVSVAEGLHDERTKPAALINAMLGVSLTSHCAMFDEGDVAQAMFRAGFRSVHSRRSEGPRPYGPTVVDIARK